MQLTLSKLLTCMLYFPRTFGGGNVLFSYYLKLIQSIIFLENVWFCCLLGLGKSGCPRNSLYRMHGIAIKPAVSNFSSKAEPVWTQKRVNVPMNFICGHVINDLHQELCIDVCFQFSYLLCHLSANDFRLLHQQVPHALTCCFLCPGQLHFTKCISWLEYDRFK